MFRRDLIIRGSSAAAFGALFLAGCQADGTASPNLKQAAADIQTFSSVLAAFSASLSTIPGAGPVLDLANKFAPVFATLATSLTSTNAGSTINTIAADISQIIMASQSPSVASALPSNVKQAISDIQIVLPAIEALIAGLTMASPSADAARARLNGFVAGKR